MTSEPDTMAEMENLVAALAALARGDQEGAELVLLGADLRVVGGLAVGILAELGPLLFGDVWLSALATWEPGQSLGEVVLQAVIDLRGDRG